MKKTENRELYQAPEVEVLEMQAEGVVCASNSRFLPIFVPSNKTVFNND